MPVILALVALLTLSSRAEAWGFAAHRAINRTAITTLPEPLASLFRGNADYLAEHAIDPDLWRTAGAPGEDPNHFFDVDAFPAERLPRSEAEHRARHGDEAASKGRLPWRVAEIYGNLVDAFRAGDAPRVLERAAVLGHYVADAHVPFHATVNYDGQLSGQTGIHSRWETSLFERFRDEILRDPRLPPAQRVTDPAVLTFEILAESAAGVAPALEADRAAVGPVDFADTIEDDRYDNGYYARLYDREGAHLRARMQDAASRLGSLWLSAWIDAGRPEMDGHFRFAYVRRQTRAILASLDGAGAQVIDDAVTRGVMPEMKRLREEGASARGSLTSLPAKTPAGHAALFTGAWSDRNGIDGTEMPLPGASVVTTASGFLSSSLRAEPIWVTAARQGLDVSVASATQAFPFAPFLEEKRFGGNFGNGLTLFDGFHALKIPAALYGSRDLPLRPAAGWQGAWPRHNGELREFDLTVRGTRIDGLLFDDPADPTEGFDTMALTVDKQANKAAILKARPLGGDADAFGRVAVQTPQGAVGLFFRLFVLSPNGSEILLFRSEAGVLRSSRPLVEGAAFGETGGFTPNGADDIYKAGGFGAPLWKGGDGTAERRYLETAQLVTRQFERLFDFAADRTRWDLLITYLPYPDEALHAWLGYLDPALSGYDAALAARLRPFMDQILGLVDRFVGHVRKRAAAPGTVLAVASDHGMSAAHRLVRFNVALQKARLLALSPDGSIDLARTRALYFPGNSGYFLINRAARPQGVVEAGAEGEVLDQLKAALLDIKDLDGAGSVVTQVIDPKDGDHEPGIGGPQGGDLYVGVLAGYSASAALQGKVVEAIPPRGEHLLNPERPEMLASFVIAGSGIAKGADLGPIRQVDVAPTLSALLGIGPPAAATGAPLCGALSRIGSPAGVESAPNDSIRCAPPPRRDSSPPH
jgi:predicted AlkP superfamily phosphohydrolase/phosphomutase